MSWLFWQTWLWYLSAFLVGVALAWVTLVRPRQRELRALRERYQAAVDEDPPSTSWADSDPLRPEQPAVDAVNEPFAAANPALSSLDTFGSAASGRTGGAATRGLGDVGWGDAPSRPTPPAERQVPGAPTRRRPGPDG